MSELDDLCSFPVFTREATQFALRAFRADLARLEALAASDPDRRDSVAGVELSVKLGQLLVSQCARSPVFR